MEFPDLGQQCFVKSCNKLDFLPVKCDQCTEIFCKDHFSYQSHSCEKASLRDVQVPVCPLCSAPIPITRGQLPDIQVSQHIDTDCQDLRARKKRAVITNKCNVKGCKQRELIPVLCSECKLNFCLKHRHFADHNCDPKAARIPSKLKGNENVPVPKHHSRLNTITSYFKPSTNNPIKKVQGSMTEDEALARALQASMNPPGAQSTATCRTVAGTSRSAQEEEDRMLAEAIAASQRDVERNKDKCVLS